MKTCSKCKMTKDFSEFVKAKSESCGYYAQCKDCKKEWRKGYQARNKEMLSIKGKEYCDRTVERRKANGALYYQREKERIREAARERYKKDKEKRRIYAKASYEKNREKRLAQKKEYLAENLHLVMARNAARRAKHMKRKPKWLTKEDMEAIREIYRTSQIYQELTGEKYHVDHIYPLLGELVSGLHVPGNLQILPAKENMLKKNHFTPE